MNAQTTRENISRLKDNNGEIYYSITRVDSTLHCSFKTENNEDVSYCLFFRDYNKQISKSAYLKLSDSIYPKIDSCFNSLPNKNEKFFIEDSDSIFITLEYRIYVMKGWYYRKPCLDFLDLRFRGGKKNAEVSIGVKIDDFNGEILGPPKIYWSKWINKKDLKSLLKKQIWQK